MRMKRIGQELQDETGALRASLLRSDAIRILDICMAPGGFTNSALVHTDNLGAEACGITLLPSFGGTILGIPQHRSTVIYLDVTMLSAEFGVNNPQPRYRHGARFLDDRPFFGRTFQLVICDGELLKQRMVGV